MNNIVVGIAGQKHSGKDTVSSIMAELLMYDIYEDYETFNFKGEENGKDRLCIIHFATSLKKSLSTIFNINIDKFYNNKDNEWYCLQNGKFYDYIPKNSNKITIDKLNNNSLSELMNNNADFIKLRTLMQYFGTNICRNNLGNDIWVNNTINRAKWILKFTNKCIISDVRFKNEAEFIKRTFPNSIIIKVNRDSNNIEHESENIDFDVDYVINNNGTLKDLFNDVKKLTQEIYGRFINN